MARSKLACLKGGRTPEVALAQAMEKVASDDIVAVVIGFIHSDTSVSADWSQTKLSAVNYCVHSLQLMIDDEMREVWIPEEYEPGSAG